MLAIVTGASTGIGKELARCCASGGFDLLICANEPEIHDAAQEFRKLGRNVEAIEADLGTPDGVELLCHAAGNGPVSVLIANAGRGLGGAFLDEDWDGALNVIDVNISGTIYLIHLIGRQMREHQNGQILIVGSTAGFIPGSYQAVYNGTKAFLDSFSYALRDELKGTGVTVTCLSPGATDTAFFERAGMIDTALGQFEAQFDPAEVAREGYEAMRRGDAGVVSGAVNKLQAAFAGVIPRTVLAEMHRRMAEPMNNSDGQEVRNIADVEF
ncbi:MAG: oxidoreductase [Alphaproteobacteria bacterium BRH_c36]|nr:MAG: oxidoreductase [Alphaproteobacteria bacterium BRH_c36]